MKMLKKSLISQQQQATQDYEQLSCNEVQTIMNESSKQIFWTSDVENLPYIEFNVNCVRNKSTYFKTSYKPNARSVIETCFTYLPQYEWITGHQHGCRTGWVSNAFQLNIGFENNGNNRIWPAFNSDDSFRSFYIDQRDYQFPNTMIFRQQGDGKFYFNGNLEHDFNQSYTGISYEYFIGDVNENGNPKASTDSQGPARWCWTKISENDVLLHQFVPAIEDDVVKVTDTVTNTIIEQSKYNGGTDIIYGVLGQ